MLDDGIPIGSEVICTYRDYPDSFEFRGIYRGRHYGGDAYAIEVIPGTGHIYDNDLHGCSGLVTEGFGWNLFAGDKMRLAETPYDPNQNGDTDEDI